jgi:predicted lysophospholipase L1 biosynthesis ABC-type transport system permease subunit
VRRALLGEKLHDSISLSIAEEKPSGSDIATGRWTPGPPSFHFS